jgi:hypothetical protein
VEAHRLLGDFTDDQLKQIPLLPDGSRLEQDATYEECRLRLLVNSPSVRRGGWSGRRRGGAVAPKSTSESTASAASDLPAAAIGMVVLRCFNVSNIWMMSASARVGFLLRFSPSARPERPDEQEGKNQSQTSNRLKTLPTMDLRASNDIRDAKNEPNPRRLLELNHEPECQFIGDQKRVERGDP